MDDISLIPDRPIQVAAVDGRDADWDTMRASLSKQGKYLVLSINNDAKTELRLYDAATLPPIALPQLPDAEISSVKIASTEDRMAFYASSSKMPRDLFVYNFSGGAPARLTPPSTIAVAPAMARPFIT